MNKKQKNIIIATLVSLALIVFISIGGSNNDSESNENKTNSDDAPSSLTIPQKNAFKQAKSYLDLHGFSRVGLIEQLSSEAGSGYDKKDATIAVDALNENWNEQAVRSAKSYTEMSSFSCQKLVDQLSSPYGNNYTLDEAAYGAKKIGVCSNDVNFNSKGLEDIIDINSGSMDKFHKFVDAGGLRPGNDLFHGFHVNNISLQTRNDGKIRSVEILIDNSYSLNDILQNMGSYCKIDNWNRTTDNYSDDFHNGEGYGKNCDVLYERTSNGGRITYAPPGALQH